MIWLLLLWLGFLTTLDRWWNGSVDTEEER
jgi:hypothetical protein